MPTAYKRYIATRKSDGALLWAESLGIPDEMSEEMLAALIRYSLQQNHARAAKLAEREIDIEFYDIPARHIVKLGSTFL